ncbi:MAG: type II toxin-antitoxin system VapC family toxin [Deltaproteobacteria bacterium]|nr:type II toxin-antitoxin system VapC family toxin [Deltaproteobacteria bacterium]
MALYYFDTSALVKYYVTEPGSTWVRRLLDERDAGTGHFQHVILIAEITRVEVAAGLAVIERAGRIRRSERDRAYTHFLSQLIHRYAVIPLTTDDLEAAANLTQRRPLRAYDAVQLATALRYRRLLAAYPLVFVCGDNTLMTAAQAEGLSTVNPFDHIAPEDQ